MRSYSYISYIVAIVCYSRRTDFVSALNLSGISGVKGVKKFVESSFFIKNFIDFCQP